MGLLPALSPVCATNIELAAAAALAATGLVLTAAPRVQADDTDPKSGPGPNYCEECFDEGLRKCLIKHNR
ncbi:hypothetical protein ACQB60_44130 [Actinomycetota bacterium Odt1-20B]